MTDFVRCGCGWAGPAVRVITDSIGNALCPKCLQRLESENKKKSEECLSCGADDALYFAMCRGCIFNDEERLE